MAGDWIKLEISTFDKPEVMAITVAIGFDDPDFTVGKLAKLWRWFDQHTLDGNANGVTKALLDRYVGVTGFCDAMQSVGWLVITDGRITLPNFEFHNGKTAKTRAQGAKRSADFRNRDESNADSVTNALPREEKRREDKKQGQNKQRGSRLTAEWSPSEMDIQFCKTERPDLDPAKTSDRFRDYWIAKPGAKGVKLDWTATWRNWVRNESAPAKPIQPQRNQMAGVI